MSGVVQNVSGPAILANYAARNAEIVPSLGRNLAACGTRATCTSTATVPLLEPNTQYEPRRTQIDVRVTKYIPLGGKTRLQANFDVYNAFNASSILNINTAFGSQGRRPTSILDERVMQLSGELTF